MRFLVTGATGFIGARLCARLLACGHKVAAFVRSPQKAVRVLDPRCQLVHGDLAELSAPSARLPDSDIVVHLAAVTRPRSSEHYQATHYQSVVDLVATLHRQAWRPTRLLFASSVVAAGPAALDQPLTEDAPCRPVDPYGHMKLAAERYLAQCGLVCTSFRPPIVIGAGSEDLLPYFALARRGVGPILGSRLQQLSFVYVEDLVDAILAMSGDHGAVSRTYFVSHAQPVDARQLWRTIGDVLGGRVRLVPIPTDLLRMVARLASILPERVVSVEGRNQLRQVVLRADQHFTCSSERLFKEHGWVARVDFREAVERTAGALLGQRQP